MRLKHIVVMLGIGTGIYFLSIKLLLIISLFVVGSVIAAGIEKGKQLRGSFAFHTCCSAFEWALMSFYLFVFESLPAHKAEPSVYYLAGVLLLITLGVYVFATANAQTILSSSDVSLYKTSEEKSNVLLAFYSVALLLAFLADLRYRLGITL